MVIHESKPGYFPVMFRRRELRELTGFAKESGTKKRHPDRFPALFSGTPSTDAPESIFYPEGIM